MLDSNCARFVGFEVEGLSLSAFTCARVCVCACVPASICALMYAGVCVFVQGVTVNL